MSRALVLDEVAIGKLLIVLGFANASLSMAMQVPNVDQNMVLLTAESIKDLLDLLPEATDAMPGRRFNQ